MRSFLVLVMGFSLFGFNLFVDHADASHTPSKRKHLSNSRSESSGSDTESDQEAQAHIRKRLITEKEQTIAETEGRLAAIEAKLTQNTEEKNRNDHIEQSSSDQPISETYDSFSTLKVNTNDEPLIDLGVRAQSALESWLKDSPKHATFVTRISNSEWNTIGKKNLDRREKTRPNTVKKLFPALGIVSRINAILSILVTRGPIENLRASIEKLAGSSTVFRQAISDLPSIPAPNEIIIEQLRRISDNNQELQDQLDIVSKLYRKRVQEDTKNRSKGVPAKEIKAAGFKNKKKEMASPVFTNDIPLTSTGLAAQDTLTHAFSKNLAWRVAHKRILNSEFNEIGEKAVLGDFKSPKDYAAQIFPFLKPASKINFLIGRIASSWGSTDNLREHLERLLKSDSFKNEIENLKEMPEVVDLILDKFREIGKKDPDLTMALDNTEKKRKNKLKEIADRYNAAKK